MDHHCECFEDLLFEPDDSLSNNEVQKLEEHLATCESCRAERDLFLESWQALGELQVDSEPTPAVRARVWEQIRAEEITPSVGPSTLEKWRGDVYLQKIAVAGLALLLGFQFGQGLRRQQNEETPASSSIQPLAVTTPSPDFIDSDLIELASQEGYSVEIFPESTEFSPLDQETLSTLAPTAEERTWLKNPRGAVVPVQYISRDSVAP